MRARSAERGTRALAAYSLAACAVVTLAVAGCSRDASGGSATPAADSATRDVGRSTQDGGGRTQPGEGRAGEAGPGRAPSSIALAARDVATVGRASLEDGTAITGDLLPIESVDVRARIDGDLVGVYVREGERVRRGQLLARFESTEQESGRQSAEADVAAAQTEVTNAEWNLEQSRELFKAGAIAERELKSTEQAAAAARARLAAAQSRLRSTSSVVRDTRVLAPTAGIVANRAVENGEHVARNTVLFTVVRNDVLELTASVPARYAAAVAAGQHVRFTADGRAFEGRVARMSPTIDPATRAITVYVQVPNASGAIKGGTFATGRIISRVVRDALAVPTAAIRQGQEGSESFVYRIEGRTLDIAPVKLGIVDESAGLAQVAEGLDEGDRVVTGNVGALGRGMQVEILGSEGRGQRVQGGANRQ